MRKSLLHHIHDYFLPHPRNNHRPHLFSIVSIAVLAVAIITFEAGYLLQTKVVFLKTDFLASVLPGALIVLTNQDRTALGLHRVTENALLAIAAQAAAEDMAAKEYFAHVSPDGKTPWYWLEQAGYRYSYAGENLAVNFTDSENVQTAWMASPTHRANIVKPQYTEAGFGTANGTYEGRETVFVVEFFATPATAKNIAVVALFPKDKEIASTSTQVLGAEVGVAPAVTSGAPTTSVTSAISVTTAGWLALLLVSPLNTLLTMLSLLFVLITFSFLIAMLLRGRTQHKNVVFGGAFLFTLILGAMLVGTWFAGPIQLPSGGQAASVQSTL